MQRRPLLLLAALAAATEPELGRATFERLKERLRGSYEDDPIGSTLGTVLVASLLFYRAERGHNPKVTSLYDALVYVATNLSVGYSDIFAKTPEGKAIGSALMIFGPAMATNILNQPKATSGAPGTDAIVDRLNRILERLEP